MFTNDSRNGLSCHYSNISGAATSRLVRNKNGEAYIRQLLLPNSQGSTIASVTASEESNSEYLTRQFTAYGQGSLDETI